MGLEQPIFTPTAAPDLTLPRAQDITTILAIIPAYNEDRFIGSTILKTKEHVDGVIVVDDGSTDATAQVALKSYAMSATWARVPR